MEKEHISYLRVTDRKVVDSNRDENWIDFYYSEIRNISILNAGTEVELSKTMQKSTEAARVLKTGGDSLDLKRRNELEVNIQEGEKAREKLIYHNLRLVMSIARKNCNKGLPFEDLIGEGNSGLVKAVDKYDWRRGCRFSTHATWWIRQSISRAIDETSRTIRIPSHMDNQIRKMDKNKEKLTKELGREPTNEELAKKLNMNLPRLTRIINWTFDPVSLDKDIDESDSNSISFGDTISNNNKNSPYNDREVENDALIRINNQNLKKEISKLPRKYGKILELKFGLDGTGEHTLEEIAYKFGMSKEGVRQIVKSMIGKLQLKSNKIFY